MEPAATSTPVHEHRRCMWAASGNHVQPRFAAKTHRLAQIEELPAGPAARPSAIQPAFPFAEWAPAVHVDHQFDWTPVAANAGEHQQRTALRTRSRLVFVVAVCMVAIIGAQPAHGRSRYSQRPIAHLQAARLKLSEYAALAGSDSSPGSASGAFE